jgi:hypothetical protein
LHYVERGKGDSIIFIHGVTGDRHIRAVAVMPAFPHNIWQRVDFHGGTTPSRRGRTWANRGRSTGGGRSQIRQHLSELRLDVSAWFLRV